MAMAMVKLVVVVVRVMEVMIPPACALFADVDGA